MHFIIQWNESFVSFIFQSKMIHKLGWILKGGAVENKALFYHFIKVYKY